MQYHNPDNEDFDGGCCDWPCSNNCDMYFSFCIRAKDSDPGNPDGCSAIVYSQGDFSTGNYYFPETGELYPGAQLSNPITFNRDATWSVSTFTSSKVMIIL